MSLRTLLGLGPRVGGRHAAPRGRRGDALAAEPNQVTAPAAATEPAAVVAVAPEPVRVSSAEPRRATVRLGFADGSEMDFDESSREWQALHVVAATLIAG